MSVRLIVVYLIISKWINIFLAWLSRSNCHNRARWQWSGLHDPLEMSRERIVHSGRTNGSLALQGGWHLATETRKSGEDGLNGGQIRQRAVYNWKNNAQDFLFYIYFFLGRRWQKDNVCEILFPSKQKSLHLWRLRPCSVSSSQQFDLAVTPAATWRTCQEPFRATGQMSEMKIPTRGYVAWHFIPQRLNSCLWSLLSPDFMILVFTWHFEPTSKVFLDRSFHCVPCRFCTRCGRHCSTSSSTSTKLWPHLKKTVKNKIFGENKVNL